MNPDVPSGKLWMTEVLAQSRYQSYVNIFSDRNEKYRI